MIYLDYNATTPMKPAVLAAMVEMMERACNPTSVNRYGRSARKAIDEARARIAAFVGVNPSQVVFTGGGAEANRLALRSRAMARIVSAIEHHDLLSEAPEALIIPVLPSGLVDLREAEKLFCRSPAPALVVLMMVNNQTGVIQPVAELAAMAKRFGHSVLTDAAQAAGRLPVDFGTLGVDMLSLSAHKMGGPQGIGALILADSAEASRLMEREGNENVAGIVGFGLAAQLAIDDLRLMPLMHRWRNDLESGMMKIARRDALVIGSGAPRVANTLCVAMDGVSTEAQVKAFDLAGIAVGGGSLRAGQTPPVSHVLHAMGFSDNVAATVLRLSFGWKTEGADLRRCLDVWGSLYRQTHPSALSSHSFAA